MAEGHKGKVRVKTYPISILRHFSAENVDRCCRHIARRLAGLFAATLMGFALFAAGPQAMAKVGGNTFATPYVIPPGGTVGAISTPPSSGAAAASTGSLTTIGGSLETVGATTTINEPLVPVVNSSAQTVPVQGQTVWFSWTPAQNTTAVITVTSNNGSAYQFQPVVAIYSFAPGVVPSVSANLAHATNYSVSPNPTINTQSPAIGTANQNNLYLPGIFQTVVTVTALANVTYMIQVDGVLNTAFPFVGQGNFTFNLQVGASNTTVPAVAFQPQSGWWYCPGVSGVGFAMEFRNSVALVNPSSFFMATFVYDGLGNARWRVGSGQMVYTATAIAAQAPTPIGGVYVPPIAANSFYTIPQAGYAIIPLQSFSGGPTLAGAVPSAAPAGNSGGLSMAFTSATKGTLAVNGFQVAIERYPFTYATPTLPPTGTATSTTTVPPQTGWYVSPTAPGTGYFFEQQANVLFMGTFMYRPSTQGGTDVWYVSTNPMTASAYSGRLYEYQGGDMLVDLLGLTNISRVVTSTIDRGPVGITFVTSATAATTATLTLGTRTLSLQRYTF